MIIKHDENEPSLYAQSLQLAAHISSRVTWSSLSHTTSLSCLIPHDQALDAQEHRKSYTKESK